jgi:membrane protein YdbS with pleckstrin-like domain
MKPLVIKSTAKVVMGWLIFSTVLLLGIAYFLYTRNWEPKPLLGLIGIPLGIDLWATFRLFQLQSRQLVLTDDMLRFEEGFLSKAQRNMMLTKIEDVRVAQSVGQRMLGVGNLAIQATGDSAPICMDNVDNARGIADRILTAAKAARKL